MNKVIPFLIMLVIAFSANSQNVTYSINSGPIFKGKHITAANAGIGWNSSPTYNESSWTYCYNGAGSDGLSGNNCGVGLNTNLWGGQDTLIWVDSVSFAPDTVCLRRIIDIPSCGHAVSAVLNIFADDYFNAYINGNFLVRQPNASNGVRDTLNSTELGWIQHGANVFAFEGLNTVPNCGKFDMAGWVTIDTSGCYRSDVTVLSEPSVSIYPNPVSSIAKVIVPEFVYADMTITDMLGNVLVVQKIYGSTEVDMSRFDNGIYLVNIENVSGSRISRKLIKIALKG